jgi:hypothetical protein
MEQHDHQARLGLLEELLHVFDVELRGQKDGHISLQQAHGSRGG